MSVRPPQILHKPQEDEDPLSQALQNEIFNEKAGNAVPAAEAARNRFRKTRSGQGRTQKPQRKQSLPTLLKRAKRSGMFRYNGRCVD